MMEGGIYGRVEIILDIVSRREFHMARSRGQIHKISKDFIREHNYSLYSRKILQKAIKHAINCE